MAGDATEADVIDALRARYAPPAFGFLSHVPTGTGGHYERTIDGVAMSLWPSRGYQILGFEVKVSRADWLRELKQPAKADAAFKCVDLWFVVTPDTGVIGPGERPKGWGWLIYRDGKIKLGAAADEKKADKISRAFLAALFRKIVANGITGAHLQDEINRAVERGVAKGRAEAHPGYDGLKQAHDQLMEKIRTFETESGLQIVAGWRDPHRLAEVVNALMKDFDSARELLVRELGALTRASEGVGRALDELDSYERSRARRCTPEQPQTTDADSATDPRL